MTEKVNASPSPEALLKQAVSGARPKPVPASALPKRFPALDARLVGAGAASLILGLVLGAGATGLALPRGDAASETLAQIQSRLDGRHTDTTRLQGDVEKITRILAQLQDVTESIRSEAKNRAAALSDRIGKSEQVVVAKIASVADRQDQTERDQSAKIAALTAQIEKRGAAPLPVPPPVTAPQAAKTATPEPSETGSLTDKAKVAAPAPIDTWAVREVYNGVAVIEDRRHRLVEVGPGDTVPGIGRVEAVERRGRSWAVVTKHGVITAQAW